MKTIILEKKNGNATEIDVGIDNLGVVLLALSKITHLHAILPHCVCLFLTHKQLD